jgi:cobalamin transport system permease protein
MKPVNLQKQFSKLSYLVLISGIIWVILSVYLGLAVGSTKFLPYLGLFENSPNYILALRLPRVFLALLTGSTLALCGASLQGLLRNPLVSPYTIGVSSGASLGAVIAIKLGLESMLGSGAGLFPIALAAGILTIFVLFMLGKSTVGWSGNTLLLAGVTLSFFCSSAIMFIQYSSTHVELFKMVRWLMGGFDFIIWRDLFLVLPILIPSVFLLLKTGGSLNILALGNETAQTSGVNITHLTIIIFAASSFAISAIVSITGPIAFVGLIIPHILRMTGVNNYKILLPASLLFGGGFLVLSDLVGRTIMAPNQIPVGVVTSLIGGPFFLFLLVKMKKKFMV